MGAPLRFDGVGDPAKRRGCHPRGFPRAPLSPLAGVPGAALGPRPTIRGSCRVCGGERLRGEVRHVADSGAVLRAVCGGVGGVYGGGNPPCGRF